MNRLLMPSNLFTNNWPDRPFGSPQIWALHSEDTLAPEENHNLMTEDRVQLWLLQ